MFEIINNETIEGIKELGEQEFLNELINLFINQSKDIVSEINTSYENNDSLNLQKSSHKLKGSSLNIGADKLGDICLNIEKFAKNNDLKSAGEFIKSLSDIYLLSCSELKKLII